MNKVGTTITVWSMDDSACIKVAGRANVTASPDFKTLVLGLHEEGYHKFILDFEDCLIMDSTFLGVLAGLAKQLHKCPERKLPHPLEIRNPSERIAELLENLGLNSFFKVTHEELPPQKSLKEIKQPSGSVDRLQLSKTSLEAHRVLMEINPNNIQKFKEVTSLLAADIKKAEEEQH